MTTIEVPARIGALPETPSGSAAMVVTDDLRGAATALSDVTTWTSGHGSPAGWQGDDADAALHAMTRFARRADVLAAALERVTGACDTYVSTMTDLDAARGRIDEDRTTLNSDIDALVARIEGATEEQVPTLETEADGLRSRATALQERVTRWEGRVTAAEDRLVAAFEAVDTRGEGVGAADAPGRVDAEALATELAGLGGPGAVTAWWDRLTPAEQEALKIHSPELVGNTNGIPSGDRDDANRGALQNDLDHLESLEDRGVELTPAQAQHLRNARAAQHAVAVGATQPHPVTGRPVDTNLLVYLPTTFGGDGAVAVAYGDPDTADNTAVVVPGMTNDGSTIAGQGEDAFRLFMESSRTGESTATIAWMGYDSPSWTGEDLLHRSVDIGGVSMERLAENGGHELSDFVDGLRATDDGDRSHLTVIGHSYGSTTAAHAATDGLDADRLVLLGSPGAGGGSDHVSDLNMPEGSVYVGSAENDFVTWLGRDDGGDGGLGMGEDPAQETFGAERIEVDDGEEFHVDEVGSVGLGNHTSYLDQGTESLDNVATIVRGEQPDVVEGREQDANDYLVDWGTDEARYQGERLYDEYVDEPIVDPLRAGAERVYEESRDLAGEAYDTGRDLYETGRDVVTDPVGSFKDAFL